MHVVIVDDDERLLHSLKQRFSDARHDVVEFGTTSPPRHLAATRPDVLVTDVGWGVQRPSARAARETRTPELTACVLSGFDDRLGKDVSRVHHFYMKPIESERLLSEIETIRRQSARP